MQDIDHAPLVSIIMPVYNRANLVTETIESVQAQTYRNWELVVVDDGSTDNTVNVIKALKEPKLKLIECERLGIGGKIKNTGIEHAEGELIAFIDSDDLWQETKLEKQVTALQKHPNAGFCLTGGYNFRTKGEPLEYFYKQHGGMVYGSLFTDFFRSELAATTPSLMFWKKNICTSGYFSEAESFSDVAFILNLAKHFKGIILYETLLFRRLHSDNDSASDWEKGYYTGIKLIQYYRKDLPKSVLKNALFSLYINFGESYLGYNRKGSAVKMFFKAWGNKPGSIIPYKKMIKAIFYNAKQPSV